MSDLPKFTNPPVREIAVAVQFIPVPQFGMREAVAVAKAFDPWEIVDVLPALEPIIEPPPGQVAGQALRFGLGVPPQRVVLSSESARWLAQVQQDRLAAHERRIGEPPTFWQVAERFRDVHARASQGLRAQLLSPPHQAELVEVIYDNLIRMDDGGQVDLGALHTILRIFASDAGTRPFEHPEQAQVGFSFSLLDEGRFVGRIRVLAEPYVVPGESPAVRMHLISRRLVGDRNADLVLQQSHADIVQVFAAVTTERMHELWGRTR